MPSLPLPPNPLLYEINTRVWLHDLSTHLHQPIHLDNVPEEELDRIAEFGFHAVWLMGVWATGPEGAEIARNIPALQREFQAALPDYSPADCVGSPYAISSYTVSPKLGGPAALARLREGLARRGLNLVLDFVCNHTARDYALLESRPEAYVLGTDADFAARPGDFFKTASGAVVAHGRDPYFPPWTDTAQLNYAQAPAREAMLAALHSIAEQCDGVRCDMAMLILPQIFAQTWGARCGPNPVASSFWREAIQSVCAQYPKFIFLAESYWDKEADLQREGFHFTYDKTLYDRLLHFDFEGVRQHLKAGSDYQRRCARFIENHDEARAAGAFGSGRSISAAAVTLFTPGMKLLHEGQLDGRRVKVPVQLIRRAEERDDAEIEVAYEHLLAALRDPIYQSGTFAVIDVNPAGPGDRSNESLVALQWIPAANGAHSRKTCCLIVINLSGGRAYARIPLSRALFSEGKHYTFDDRFDGKRYDREGAELIYPGIYIALEAYQPHVFEVSEKV